MKIKVTKIGSKKLTNFYRKEWAEVDKDHYGRNVEWESWIPKNFSLEAYDDEQIVGALTFSIHQDVSVIELFITAKSYRGKGIGKLLLDKVEKISKKNGVHKIYLQTGQNWKAVEYYKKHGFVQTGTVPDHYFHVDYVELSKFI